MKLSPPPVRDRYPVTQEWADIPRAWQKWFSELFEFSRQPVTPPEYLTADIPPAANYPGGVIYVSDAAAGSNFQGSNGTAWVDLG